MRLFATLGPGDIVDAHRRHLDGEAIVSETSITFSGQLFEWCRLAGIDLMACSYHPRVDRIDDGRIHARNVPKRWGGQHGVMFHLSELFYAVRIARAARAFGADLALIDSGTTHYFLLWLLRLSGTRVVVNFHNVMWPQGYKPTGIVSRSVTWLNGRFFRRGVAASMGCSPECGRQVDELAGRTLPYFEWRGQFRRDGFAQGAAETNERPFRLLYVGRAEENKGVLDLVEIARRLARRAPGQVKIEVCGDGGALPELRRRIVEAGLESTLVTHGRLQRPALLAAYVRSNAVIVPTRGSFCEGLPLVCAEAVISRRPIVTSALSNALPVLGPAIVEAPPEDLDGYVEAILSLATDPAVYAARVAACGHLAEQFFNRERSYPAALQRLLAAIGDAPPVTPAADDVFERLV